MTSEETLNRLQTIISAVKYYNSPDSNVENPEVLATLRTCVNELCDMLGDVAKVAMSIETTDTNDYYKGTFVYDEYSQQIHVNRGSPMVAQIADEDSNLLLMRGWGGLHTTFGDDKAAKIQDAFGRRIAELLNTFGVGQEVNDLINNHG